MSIFQMRLCHKSKVAQAWTELDRKWGASGLVDGGELMLMVPGSSFNKLLKFRFLCHYTPPPACPLHPAPMPTSAEGASAMPLGARRVQLSAETPALLEPGHHLGASQEQRALRKTLGTLREGMLGIAQSYPLAPPHGQSGSDQALCVTS